MGPTGNNIVKLKCPLCGGVLSVRKMPGIEHLSISCPACKQKSIFSAYITLCEAVVEPQKPQKPAKPAPRAAQAPQPNVAHLQPEPPITPQPEYPVHQQPVQPQQQFNQQPGPDTPPPMPINYSIGCLRVVATGQTFQLQFGRNVVGRRASGSTADFQISTNGSKRMSREHIVVDVRKDPNVGFVHSVSLAKERVNDTYVGNTLLTYGNEIELKVGKVISLPDADLIFEFPDEDMTVI
jgi:phage FluMu protein Com